MFCGAGSFSHVDEDPGFPPSPRGSRRKHGAGNPYAARGLEKFSMVLADLESRREKIMAKAGSQGVSVIRFVYNSQDWVPIIVRRGGTTPEERPEEEGGSVEAHKELDVPHEQPAAPRTAEHDPGRAVKKSFSWKLGEGEGGGFRSLLRWKDSYYWPAVAVMILLCLAVFGRVFAICCTCVWWYLVPAMKAGEGRNVRKPLKDYRRRMSDKRLGGAGGDDAAASAAGKRAAGAVDGPASPRRHAAAAKRG